jgi:hypothetical protein
MKTMGIVINALRDMVFSDLMPISFQSARRPTPLQPVLLEFGLSHISNFIFRGRTESTLKATSASGSFDPDLRVKQRARLTQTDGVSPANIVFAELMSDWAQKGEPAHLPSLPLGLL